MMKYMKRILSVVLLAAMLLTAGCGASAENANYESVTSVHPDNVRIDLFDYWVNSETNDITTYVHSDHRDLGINNNHALLFLKQDSGQAKGWWNARTTGRLVKPYLVNGYPVLDLDAAHDKHDTGMAKEIYKTFSQIKAEDTTNTIFAANSKASADESLAYLFNDKDVSSSEDPVQGKRRYADVKNLLLENQENNEYFFNSKDYYAEYSKNAKEFSVYKRKSGDIFQFFPFDDIGAFINNGRGGMKHWFGMVMEIDFYLTDDGKIHYSDGRDPEDIKFHFSGDDDVFIFVDNMLVGSVGGMHGARAIDINFATGEITESRSENGVDDEEVKNAHETSISEYYTMAKDGLMAATNSGGMGKSETEAEAYLPNLYTTKDNIKTLEPNVMHTLRMYYLERGNYSSNLEVSFNLLNPYLPSSDYMLTHAVTDGNSTLRAVLFTYDFTFDMSDVIGTAVEETAKYTIKAGNDVVETGTVTFSVGENGDVSSRKILSMVKEDGTASTYLTADDKVELKNGQSITFTLPDLTKVTSVQSLPAENEIPNALTGMPFDTPDRSVDDDFGAADETNNAKIEATVFANLLSDENPLVVGYTNAVLTSTVTVNKTVTGENPPDGTFNFVVKNLDDVERVDEVAYPANFMLNNNGTRTLTVIRGATFNVEETDDPNDKFVYVSGGGAVTADADGETVEFKNFYVAPVTVSLQAQKTITGRGFKAGDSFTFTISAAEGTPMPEDASKTINPAATDGNGPVDVAFDEITFDLSDLGGEEEKTFTYTIAETDVLAAGVSKDETTYTAEVTLTKSGNGENTELEASVAYYKADDTTALDENQVPEFVNTYSSTGTLTIHGEKLIENRDFKAGDSFTFTISAADGTPMPAEKSVTIEPTSDAIKVFSFGEITYDLSNSGKEYTYTLTETPPQDSTEADGRFVKDGLTYDTAEKTVTVTVTDNLEGDLTVKAYLYFEDGENALEITAHDPLTWTNTYAASGSASLTGTKTITGRTFQQGDSFTFTISAAEGTPMPAGSALNEATQKNEKSVAITPDAGASTWPIAFDAIAFTEEDIGETYTYEIREETGSLPGVTYSTAVHTVTIDVADNGNGTLTATPYLGEVPDTRTPITNASALTWTNTYASSGSVSLSGTKTITGRDFKAGDSFTFTISAADGTPMPAEKSVTIKPTSGTSATIDFGTLNFDQTHVGKEYTYTFAEVTPAQGTGLPGVAYSGVQYEVVVRLTDDGQGNITAKACLKGEGGSETEIADASALTWNNTFSQQPGTYTFSVRKELTGREITDGEFTFTLKPLGRAAYQADADGYVAEADSVKLVPMPENGGTAAANAAGAVSFGGAVFTPEMFGWEVTGEDGGYVYLYSIAENVPTEAVAAEGERPVYRGVSYDTTEYKLAVHAYTVVENDSVVAKAELIGADPAIGEGVVVFRNSYQAASVLTPIMMAKHVNGEQPDEAHDGAFSFTLTAQQPDTPMPMGGEPGSASQTVFNDGSEISFGEILYDKTGEYLYTVKEDALPGHISGMLTDPAAYTMKVLVEDPGDGQLTAAVLFCADPSAQNAVWTESLTFNNDYERPLPQKLVGVKSVKDDEHEVEIGEEITWMIQITNHTRDYVRDVVVMDELDQNTVFHSCSHGGTYDPQTRRVTFVIDRLDAGESVTLEITVNTTIAKEFVYNEAVFGTPDIPETMRGDMPAQVTNRVKVWSSEWKPNDLPNTGDDRHMGLWLLLLAGSLMGLLAVKRRAGA